MVTPTGTKFFIKSRNKIIREGTELSETFIEHYENIVENSSEIQLTHVARGNIFDAD